MNLMRNNYKTQVLLVNAVEWQWINKYRFVRNKFQKWTYCHLAIYLVSVRIVFGNHFFQYFHRSGSRRWTTDNKNYNFVWHLFESIIILTILVTKVIHLIKLQQLYNSLERTKGSIRFSNHFLEFLFSLWIIITMPETYWPTWSCPWLF
jgi:hypothetical protein